MSQTPSSRIESRLNRTTKELFDCILNRCQRRLRRFCGASAQDAAQDVMVELLKRGYLSRFDPRRGNLWAYLRGTIDNICHKHARDCVKADGRRSSVDPDQLTASTIDPSTAVEGLEVQRDLEEAEHSLTPGELDALHDVIDAASGSRQQYGSRQRVNLTARSRCRKRLRHVLRKHAPRKT